MTRVGRCIAATAIAAALLCFGALADDEECGFDVLFSEDIEYDGCHSVAGSVVECQVYALIVAVVGNGYAESTSDRAYCELHYQRGKENEGGAYRGNFSVHTDIMCNAGKNRRA